MLIEILSITVLIVFVMTLRKEKSNSPSSASVKPVVVVPRLTLEGTEPTPENIDFLRGFGIPRKLLADLRYFCAPTEVSREALPPELLSCLERSYEEGKGRSLELAHFLKAGEPLKVSQAIYFALLATEGLPPFIVSFIGKRPSAPRPTTP